MHHKLSTVLFVALLVVAPFAMGQEFRATIAGHVYDSSGAAVPNAKIQAVHVATGETTNATSEASGVYTVPFLRPGVYKLTVTGEGFKQFVREPITLEVGKLVGIDVVLEVGQVTEVINVTAEAALLETQTATRVGVVNTQQVSDLPLNSRNPFMLGAMMSGVVFRGAAIWQRPFDNGAIAEWSVNGGRQANNEFLMDGAPNNGQAGGNNIAYVPIVDAVQEFSVQQNSYDAQYGHTGGGVFNVVLKSGTNEHHGTAWEFMRRKPLDANTFQNNALGNKPDGTPNSPRPAHMLDQYGFQLEGPLRFPGLLKKDGRVKVFYLGSIEDYYEEWPQFLRNSFPAMEMRDGDFSKLVTSDGRPITIYNPFTTTFAANGDPIRAPFENNRIPASLINPVARNVTKYMPQPNTTTPAQRYSVQNHLLPEYAATDNYYNLILKFDWNFGDRHRAFFRHASNDRTEDRCINGICQGPAMDGQQPFQRINDAYVIDYVSTVTPYLIVNLRASHNRFIEKGFGRGNEGFDLTSLGLPSNIVSQLPTPRYFGRWEFGGNYSVLGRYQGINITNNYGLAGNITKIQGPHTLKFGVDLRRIHYIQQNTGNILFFNATSGWTQRLYNQGEATAGDPYASFLLGLVNNASANYPLYPFNRWWYLSPYFQDDWKVSRKLTVNMGLRWDYNGPPDEKYNRMNRGFDPKLATPIASQIPADMLALYPNLRNLTGGLRFVGVDGQSTLASKRVWTNFAPRFGAAFSITKKLVMRGGYGLYFMNPNNNYLQYAGFSASTTMVTTNDGGRTPIPNLLGNPYPSGINVPRGAGLGALTFAGQNQTWFDPTFTTPQYHSFSFGFQYQVTPTSTVDISYVGSRTIGANSEKDFNIPTLDFRKTCNLLEGGSPVFCDQQITNPFRNIEAFRGTGHFTNATLSRYQLARPFPQFSGNMLQQGRNDSVIRYNSLQFNYNYRFARGLNLLGNYTLSKMVERWGFNDAFNNVEQQGLYFNDRPHFVKATVVYDLPFGKGKRFGADARGFVSKLISGWEVTTFYNHASGEPNNLAGNVIMLKDPRVSSIDWNAHQVRGWNPCTLRQFNDGTTRATNCPAGSTDYYWLQTAGYAPRTTPYRSGQIRKQALLTMDSSIIKTTSITERVRFQVGLEAFNILNHYYFGRDSNFETNPENPNFGTLFPSQAWIGNGYPRQVQIRMKLYW